MKNWEDYTISDGASIPMFFRQWIICRYGYPTMALIDRGGKFHDYLTYKYPNTKRHNRKRFIKLLNKYGVPKQLVRTINVGLFLYDISPAWFARYMKKKQQEAYQPNNK